MSSKLCYGCQRNLTLDRFSPNTKSLDGYQTKCKSCLTGLKYGMNANDLREIVEMQEFECAFCEKAISFEVRDRQDFVMDHNHALLKKYEDDFAERHEGTRPNKVQRRAIMQRTLRGLLCSRCNSEIFTTAMIELLEDEERMEKAMKYRDMLCYPPDQAFIDEYGGDV